MSGLHRLRPPEEVPMPLWLLSDLLAFLRSPLFEPLSLASDYHVFAKTLILLLLATGCRISEIAGLSRDIKETNKTTVLRWVNNFTPKHWTKDFHPSSPSFTLLIGAKDVRTNKMLPSQTGFLPISVWKIGQQSIGVGDVGDEDGDLKTLD